MPQLSQEANTGSAVRSYYRMWRIGSEFFSTEKDAQESDEGQAGAIPQKVYVGILRPKENLLEELNRGGTNTLTIFPGRPSRN